MDLLFTATSDDGMWEFGLDVYAEATYPMTGDIADWDWNTLEITQLKDIHKNPMRPEDQAQHYWDKKNSMGEK